MKIRMNDLGKIFEKHGTDKASKHKYHLIYDNIFKSKRNKEVDFLEVGIWKGVGMASFLEYFPKGNIYGLDIFTRIKPEEIPILKNPRTSWIKADSTHPSCMPLVKLFNTKFDFILDDGAHWPEANKLTFRHLKKFLKPDGVYIIEDVWPMERMTNSQLNHKWLKQHPDRYNHLSNEMFLKELEDSGMEIERFDNREIAHPDSYVITLKNK
jgi:SAM-dependent methyltransferase